MATFSRARKEEQAAGALDRLESLMQWAEDSSYLQPGEAAKMRGKIALARANVDTNLVWAQQTQRRLQSRAAAELQKAGLSFEFFSVA